MRISYRLCRHVVLHLHAPWVLPRLPFPLTSRYHHHPRQLCHSIQSPLICLRPLIALPIVVPTACVAAKETANTQQFGIDHASANLASFRHEKALGGVLLAANLHEIRRAPCITQLGAVCLFALRLLLLLLLFCLFSPIGEVCLFALRFFPSPWEDPPAIASAPSVSRHARDGWESVHRRMARGASDPCWTECTR